jgi:leader peptidase (prepilin peptidase)/N-methyltransferase
MIICQLSMERVVIILYALLGFALGAPINALADALPLHKPVEWPAYLTRRAPPRFREVAVHLATAALFAFLWTRYAGEDFVQLALVTGYTLVLALVTVTDLEHRLIPDWAILPAIGLAALAAPLRFGDRWAFALAGGAVGFIFFFIAARLGERLLGSGALGYGDVKLAAFVGLISSFPQVFVALVVALTAGGVIGLLLLVTRRVTMRSAIPYGPFIVIGGFYAMVWGTEVVRWYAAKF